VILQDAIVPGGRLRQQCRDGLLLILGEMCDSSLFADVSGMGMVAPLAVRELAEIDVSGNLAETLGVRPGEAWLIRPDAHIAAIVPRAGAESVAAAVSRVLWLSKVGP
jgi:pentachlorophenol monooxygenase/3-(3-hydroxy-phenyl)propionate hydroxylase